MCQSSLDSFDYQQNLVLSRLENPSLARPHVWQLRCPSNFARLQTSSRLNGDDRMRYAFLTSALRRLLPLGLAVLVTSGTWGQQTDQQGAQLPRLRKPNRPRRFQSRHRSRLDSCRRTSPSRAGNCGKLNRPASSVCALRFRPVSRFVIVTVASGTTALVASLTSPTMALVVSP